MNEEEEEVFEVQEVLNYSLMYDQHWYLVHWKGFDDPSEHTWQSIDTLLECSDLVLNYHKKTKTPRTGYHALLNLLQKTQENDKKKNDKPDPPPDRRRRKNEKKQEKIKEKTQPVHVEKKLYKKVEDTKIVLDIPKPKSKDTKRKGKKEKEKKKKSNEIIDYSTYFQGKAKEETTLSKKLYAMTSFNPTIKPIPDYLDIEGIFQMNKVNNQICFYIQLSDGEMQWSDFASVYQRDHDMIIDYLIPYQQYQPFKTSQNTDD